MNIRYKNDLNCSYMIIDDCNASPEFFTIRMLESNSVPGLLDFRCEQIDGGLHYYYEITGRQSFEKMFETEKMSYHLLERFLSSFKELAASVSEYLLDGQDIVFLPKCIFTDYSCETFLFCCAPGNGADQVSDIRDLVNMLISVIDYNDPQAVNLAFALSSAVRSDFFTIASLAEIDAGSYSTSEDGADSQGASRLQHEIPSQSEEARNAASYGAPDPSMADIAAAKSSGTKERKSAKKSRKKKKSEESDIPAESQQTFTFKDKAKTYFKGRSFSDVYDDMNSGKIFRKIQNIQPEVPSDFPFFTAEEISRANSPGTIPQPSFSVLMEDNVYMNGSKKASDRSDHSESKGFAGKDGTASAAGGSFDLYDQPGPDEATTRLVIPPAYKRKLEGGGSLSGISAPLDHFPFTIGKGASGCDLKLDNRTVSRIHCRIYSDPEHPDTYYLEDQNSTNGTYLNSNRLEPYSREKLEVGDQIRLAREELYFL